MSSPEIIPEVVRKAFAVAESEKPGATHLELPEDVMQRPLDASALPRHAPVQPEPGGKELQRAADLIDAARNPLALAGNGAIRGHAARALRSFVHNTGIPVAETFMAKGLVDYEDPKALGTVGLQARDYEMAGFDDADLVIAIGYDLVEHSPKHWNPRRDKQIIMIDSVAAEVDQNFVPDVELIGDIAHVLARLAAGCTRNQTTAGTSRLHEVVIGALNEARDDDHFPMRPPRVLWDIREALGRDDILVSDVGLHKLWIGRMFPAHEPGTVLIANGLAGMGFALPTAIGAKLVRPDRNVVAVSGDGGFLMNCQELETAVRPQDPRGQHHLGERAVRLDRVEAGQEVRPPLRRRLRKPGLRQAGRGVRAAGVAMLDRRRLPSPAGRRPRAGHPLADRRADRLLDRRRDLRDARR